MKTLGVILVKEEIARTQNRLACLYNDFYKKAAKCEYNKDQRYCKHKKFRPHKTICCILDCPL